MITYLKSSSTVPTSTSTHPPTGRLSLQGLVGKAESGRCFKVRQPQAPPHSIKKNGSPFGASLFRSIPRSCHAERRKRRNGGIASFPSMPQKPTPKVIYFDRSYKTKVGPRKGCCTILFPVIRRTIGYLPCRSSAQYISMMIFAHSPQTLEAPGSVLQLRTRIASPT